MHLGGGSRHADPVLKEFLYVMERKCIFDLSRSEVTQQYTKVFESLANISVLPSNFPWQVPEDRLRVQFTFHQSSTPRWECCWLLPVSSSRV